VSHPESFWNDARHARKLLVLDLGFLGDTVHLLPALWSIRQAWPEAELHVMVGEHVTELLQVTPWVDKVWGYPRFPKGPKPWQDLGRVGKLRAAGFDAVINLNGSDRSSLLTWLSGARWRLGRRPQGGGPWHWPFQFTHTVDHPYATMPVYEQRWNCLGLAGIPIGTAPEFRVDISPEGRRAAGIAAEEDGTYIHISPFTTQDQKELPEVELVSLISSLQVDGREHRVVVSCAPTERERLKLARILAPLAKHPWRIFDGSLKTMDLVSVIAGARVHLGGDSGALHLALMAGVPTVSWFRKYEGLTDWAPNALRHTVLVGQAGGDQGLKGIFANELLSATFSTFSTNIASMDTAGIASIPSEPHAVE
jgi:ADP-heptose:LPS heptosyltransferase